MPSHTIVAVYDTDAHADLAIAELVMGGVPEACIRHYTDETKTVISASETAPVDGKRQSAFWAWLMGEDESPADHVLYDRSIERGNTVVTVIADDASVERISAILEDHAPLKIETGGDPGLAAAETPVDAHVRRYTTAHEVDERIRLRDLAFGNRE